MTAQDLKYSSSTIQADLDRFQRQKVADLREMTINMARSHRDWCKKVGPYRFEIVLVQSQSYCPRTSRHGKLPRKKLRRFQNTPILHRRRSMHKVRVHHTFGETLPPPSTAGEDVVTSALDFETHADSWLPFTFSPSAFYLCQIALGALIYCWIYRGSSVLY